MDYVNVSAFNLIFCVEDGSVSQDDSGVTAHQVLGSLYSGHLSYKWNSRTREVDDVDFGTLLTAEESSF